MQVFIGLFVLLGSLAVGVILMAIGEHATAGMIIAGFGVPIGIVITLAC